MIVKYPYSIDRRRNATSRCDNLTSKSNNVIWSPNNYYLRCNNVTSRCNNVTWRRNNVTSRCNNVTWRCDNVTWRHDNFQKAYYPEIMVGNESKKPAIKSWGCTCKRKNMVQSFSLAKHSETKLAKAKS